jgi:predicted transcriptional regulator
MNYPTKVYHRIIKKRSGTLTEDDIAEIMNRDSDKILCQRF